MEIRHIFSAFLARCLPADHPNGISRSVHEVIEPVVKRRFHRSVDHVATLSRTDEHACSGFCQLSVMLPV